MKLLQKNKGKAKIAAIRIAPIKKLLPGTNFDTIPIKGIKTHVLTANENSRGIGKVRKRTAHGPNVQAKKGFISSIFIISVHAMSTAKQFTMRK